MSILLRPFCLLDICGACASRAPSLLQDLGSPWSVAVEIDPHAGLCAAAASCMHSCWTEEGAEAGHSESQQKYICCRALVLSYEDSSR